MRWGIKQEVVARADPVLLTSRPEPLKKKKKKKTKTKTPPLKLKCQSGQNSDSE